MPLVTASSINDDLLTPYRVRGYYVYDQMDKDVAAVVEMLVDGESRVPRYVLIEIGGIMAIRGRRVAIPWGAVSKAGMSRLDVNRTEEELMTAPVPLDPLAPTPAEEEAIHSYFRVEPYWLDEDRLRKEREEVERPTAGLDEDLPELELEGSDDQS